MKRHQNQALDQVRDDLPSGPLFNFIFRQIEKKYSILLLWVLFLSEIFLIIPLDLVLGIFVLKYKDQVVRITFSAALCSMISAAIGYAIGSFAFENFYKVIFWFISESSFLKINTAYKLYEEFVVFFATLLPFPFKIITLSAGIHRLPFFKFLATVFFARWLRFLGISLITLRVGGKMFRVFEKYTYPIAIATGVLLFCIYLWITN